MTPDSSISLLKVKIGSENLFGLETHGNNFFERIYFFWQVSAQTFLWHTTNITFAFPNVRDWSTNDSHDLILGQKLTPDSLIILLKLKIASEVLFEPENHEDDFFEKIGFFWQVSVQTFLWDFHFEMSGIGLQTISHHLIWGQKIDSKQPYDPFEGKNRFRSLIWAWKPWEWLFWKNLIFLTSKCSKFSLTRN